MLSRSLYTFMFLCNLTGMTITLLKMIRYFMDRLRYPLNLSTYEICTSRPSNIYLISTYDMQLDYIIRVPCKLHTRIRKYIFKRMPKNKRDEPLLPTYICMYKKINIIYILCFIHFSLRALYL